MAPNLEMNDYPPGIYMRDAMNVLRKPGPGVSPQTVEIDARPRWGRYRVTFVVQRTSEQGMEHYWYWVAEAGKRL